jgi:hypothetical protein
LKDTTTKNHKPLKHWLTLDFFERKMRLHTDRLYEECGEGRRFEDWLKAAMEVLATLNAG